MGRGIHFWPVVEVFATQVTAIPFQLIEGSEPIDLTSYTVTMTAAFNGTVKFTEDLTIIDPAKGEAELPALDLFDESGDWESIIEVKGPVDEKFFTEEFLFRVKTPTGV